MPYIPTVLGPVSGDRLGRTLMHEHIFCADTRSEKDYSVLDRRALAERGRILLSEARRAGYDTFVDATPFNLLRDIPLMREIAASTGMNIIASFGFYYFPHDVLQRMSEAELARRMIDLATAGLDDTSVRPGLIKCTTQGEITPFHRKLLRVAARVHRATGLPISTHSCRATALEQQAILLEEGVAPGRLVIGHCGDYHDLPLQTALLRRGSFIGMDRTGNDAQRIQTIADLCRAGYAQQLVLSHDRSVYLDFDHPDADPLTVWTAQDKAHTPEGRRHFLYLEDVILPGLRREGVSEEQIDAMLRRNPARFFGCTASPSEEESHHE